MPRKPKDRPALTPGRKRLAGDQHGIRTTVTITPEQASWLTEQPGGASAAVRRLIEKETAVKAYLISNTQGTDLGQYEGKDAEEAIAAMMSDAGGAYGR